MTKFKTSNFKLLRQQERDFYLGISDLHNIVEHPINKQENCHNPKPKRDQISYINGLIK